MSDLENKWYSNHLSAAQEPSLYQTPPKQGSYPDSIRFTWLRSFDYPVIVRLDGVHSPSAKLVAKQLTGAGGYDPGSVSKRIQRQLTREQTARLRNLLITTHAMALPSRICDGGLDGADWLIEISDRHEYHFLSRWTPNNGEVREIGLAMLKLTGWSFGRIY
jgi:hypothetical protein